MPGHIKELITRQKVVHNHRLLDGVKRATQHALLAEVERMGNTPMPPAQRTERMKVLEEEADQVQRVEEVLIARQGAERLTNCAPAAVLGVRVADAHGFRAA